MSLADELKNRTLPMTKKRNVPLWQGPEDSGPQGGITFSLLSRWLCCRERFRLHAIEGLGLPDRFNHRLEYGSMWHICEEAYARADNLWGARLLDYAKKLAERYPTDQEEVDKWYRVCKVQFPIYVDYWKKHPDMQARTPLLQEVAFRVPYQLPSRRVVYLRGKWDSVDLVARAVDRSRRQPVIYLQENKSKGDIDPNQLQRQLKFDLQTMLYLVALEAPEGLATYVTNGRHPLGGIRYNVIRRPLSGGRYAIRQNKNESREDFYNRLGSLIRGDPGWFFMRWNVDIVAEDIQVFRRTCLNPLLEQVCLWYDAFSHKNREVPRLNAHCLHFRMPYGVYNSLVEGTVGELDNVIDSGTTVGLRPIDDLFPELSE